MPDFFNVCLYAKHKINLTWPNGEFAKYSQ